MRKTLALTILLVSFYTQLTFAQDSLITSLAKSNLSIFTKDGNKFTGAGWDNILTRAKSSDNVLIGEDHFTNETPFFVSALASQIRFDNFFCEIDPFTARILQDKIKTLSAPEMEKYVADYGNTFSFYAFAPEFDLLKQFTRSNTTINGTDQILLVGDALICNELQKTTQSNRAKEIYELIKNNSKTYFANFLKDQSKPFYLLTPEFEKNLDELSALKLSEHEVKIINALRLSAKIYKSQSHHLRVQLMKNQLMQVYTQWQDKKNLYKYGANHVAKDEGLMDTYDIGNLVSSIADSKFSSSYHIIVLGVSGTQASPFKGFPSEKVDANSGVLKSLSPLLKAVDGNGWHCIDLKPLRAALEDGKLVIKDNKLLHIIKGYDAFVVIPEVTASAFTEGK
nr:hypothetical protein [Mucilaginibacter sp. L294]